MNQAASPRHRLAGCGAGWPGRRAIGMRVACLAVMVLVAGLVVAPAAAGDRTLELPELGQPAFVRLWARTDYLVQRGLVQRGYYYGPGVLLRCDEPYGGGTRPVVYLDKARLELTVPDSGQVSAGLLARELISGQIQLGDSEFRASQPAAVPVAGDQTATDSPTYAALSAVSSLVPGQQRAQPRLGQTITATIDRAGRVGDDPDLARYGATYGTYREELGHNVAQVFLDFFALRGPVAALAADETITLREERLIDWLTVVGLPIAEAYWAVVPVGCQPRWILLQPFERRVLTYTPDNAPPFQVEMGNTGLAYRRWRHPDGSCAERPPAVPVGAAAALASSERAQPGGGPWLAAGELGEARTGHTATRLADGRVLVVGGLGRAGVLASAELFDAASGRWTAATSLSVARTQHTATLLADGTVLVVGGFRHFDRFSAEMVASAERYDPATGQWLTAGATITAHAAHTATPLADGRVLVVGGYRAWPMVVAAEAELYDPATGQWSATGRLAVGRWAHSATRLPDGTVLVAGGGGGSEPTRATAERYVPASGQWRPTSALATARQAHTATLLPDGRVVAAGGFGSAGYLASAEIYEPAAERWSLTGALTTVRSLHAALLDADDRLVVIGGWSATELQASGERYDPSSGTWAPTAALMTPRADHTATRLADGALLVVGGTGPP